MADPKQKDAIETPAPPPARKPVRLNITARDGEVHIAGDAEGLERLASACNTAIRRWKEDASTMLVAQPSKKGGPTTPVFVIGLQ